QENAGDIKLRRRCNESHRHRDQAPQAHDPHDGLARTDLLQEQIARHFKQDIADIEQADAKAVTRIGEAQVIPELQLGEADVDPVDIVQDVANKNERDDPQDHLAVETASVVAFNRL